MIMFDKIGQSVLLSPFIIGYDGMMGVLLVSVPVFILFDILSFKVVFKSEVYSRVFCNH